MTNRATNQAANQATDHATYEVRTEKVIGRPANEVFHALKEGRLFTNCGANSGTMKIDFRVGGRYQIVFKNHKLINFGEFLEIVPDRKIVFSWCQTFGADQKPDTQVTIELFGDGANTRLVLVHTGFKSKESADNHQGGWNGGATDFASEIESGRLRFVRNFDVSVETLAETCKNPSNSFYDAMNGGNVTLSFHRKDGGRSSLELIHNGLVNDDDHKARRQGWETVFEKLTETFATHAKEGRLPAS